MNIIPGLYKCDLSEDVHSYQSFCRYGYSVSDDQGLDFTQQETSEAGVVTGSYSVALPDGRIQTVKYSVGPDTGYVVSKATHFFCSQDILSNKLCLIPEISLNVNYDNNRSVCCEFICLLNVDNE